ncbi:hypothetical protein NZ47_03375 [Anaerovibrio lipolyticus]|uniref:IrrE N-terminal-like domain-containing protein n=1 Tax=Anaerovibrio lipolyticus TaxID=82374 RepID=A0A0B2JYJ8_9FIRM|nr:ImmA/IrrE family metallo-endopeptidase [Anaerovibrio lipolyticus]KHM52654.1 hypothetical protein NZ47_03375 [Anaerovibrio lipolyticus]
MSDVLGTSLFKQQPEKFSEIAELAVLLSKEYCGTAIIRESIFVIVSNYARKKGLPLEILRFPTKDDELWAFTFVKKGIVFVYVNTRLALCKQFFAIAHEFYHIHCYKDDSEFSIISEGSLLDRKTVDEAAASQEDLEANAFAGLLLMPNNMIDEQMTIYGIEKENITIDDILLFMDLFAIPFKAVILRLVEHNVISEEKAYDILNTDSDMVNSRIEITGRAKQWQQNSSKLVYFGSLKDDIEYNTEKGFLSESREEADRKSIQIIQNSFQEKD